jgi:phosphoribosyl 1,2-cyclic phosphodiesterase
LKLIFLGTRGNIDAKTTRHNRHSSILISYKKTKIIIDWGLDWLKKTKKLKEIHPNAIFITHAHPDHVQGLKNGCNFPVYATKESWKMIEKYPIQIKHTIKVKQKIKIGNLTIQVFPVIHSLTAPAVGYKVSAGKKTIFYVSDLISIIDQKKALKNVVIYIGDGASITRPIIRMHDKIPMGHTTIKNQIEWCSKEGIRKAIFTHCGSQIVKGDGRTLGAKIRAIGKAYGVNVKIAYDGMKILV